MIINVKFVVIQHKQTKEVWATEVLKDDQDNFIQLLPIDSDDWELNREFTENYGGWQNTRYLKNSENFEVKYLNKDINILELLNKH